MSPLKDDDRAATSAASYREFMEAQPIALWVNHGEQLARGWEEKAGGMVRIPYVWAEKMIAAKLFREDGKLDSEGTLIYVPFEKEMRPALSVFILTNQDPKPGGHALYGAPTYSDLYVVAATSEDEAKRLAHKRAGGTSGFNGWIGPSTKCRSVGSAAAAEPIVFYPPDRPGQY